MAVKNSCYDEVMAVAEDYFGPAAQRMMGRLISNHLQKDPAAITTDDLEALTKWTRLAASLVTEDREAVDEFVERLRRLS